MKFIANHLYIVSTPIGNLEDITLRAINVLKNSDIILCEDTRRSIKLLDHLKLKNNYFPTINLTKKNKSQKLLNILKGKILSLISDAAHNAIRSRKNIDK